MSNTNVMFIGGFSGTSKSNGKTFYGLNFATEPNKAIDNHFGYEVATIFVNADDFKRFSMVQSMSYVNAKLIYARGGWVLLEYNI